MKSGKGYYRYEIEFYNFDLQSKFFIKLENEILLEPNLYACFTPSELDEIFGTHSIHYPHVYLKNAFDAKLFFTFVAHIGVFINQDFHNGLYHFYRLFTSRLEEYGYKLGDDYAFKSLKFVGSHPKEDRIGEHYLIDKGESKDIRVTDTGVDNLELILEKIMKKV